MHYYDCFDGGHTTIPRHLGIEAIQKLGRRYGAQPMSCPNGSCSSSSLQHEADDRAKSFSNPYLLGAVVVTTILQLMLVHVPPLRAFFDTYYLEPIELAICFGFSALMFV